MSEFFVQKAAESLWKWLSTTAPLKGAEKNRLILNWCLLHTEIFSKRRKIYSCECAKDLSWWATLHQNGGGAETFCNSVGSDWHLTSNSAGTPVLVGQTGQGHAKLTKRIPSQQLPVFPGSLFPPPLLQIKVDSASGATWHHRLDSQLQVPAQTFSFLPSGGATVGSGYLPSICCKFFDRGRTLFTGVNPPVWNWGAQGDFGWWFPPRSPPVWLKHRHPSQGSCKGSREMGVFLASCSASLLGLLAKIKV